MSRFRVSKYRNAFPAAAKKEFWVHDLNVGSDPKPQSNASLIKASCTNVAFISDFRSIGSVSLLPLGSYGRNTSFPHLSGHSGAVNDFDFSPFDDNLLSTCSEDGTVKLWNVTDRSCQSTLGPFGSAVDSVSFHPQADNLLVFSEKNSVTVYDVSSNNSVYSTELDTNVQAICWSGDGALIGVVSKSDKKKCVRVYDPRQKECVLESQYHSSLKGSSIVWMGDRKQFITTGYNQSRSAEVSLWNISNSAKPVHSSSLGSSSGSVPLAFYDEDTCMAYACMKGETSVSFFELQDKDPFLSMGPNVYSGKEQIKGACCVPKRALNVMECEVARLLILSQSAIVPLSYVVQRKSHAEFHVDLFPDTAGPSPAATVDQWLTGINSQRDKVSLDPHKQPKKKDKITPKEDKITSEKKESNPAPTNTSTPKPQTSKPVETIDGPSNDKKPSDVVATPTANTAAKKLINIVRVSKVRHIEGKILHKSLSIVSLPKLSNSLTGDCNGFTANKERVAFCLFGNGGQTGVYELKNTGRLDANKLLKLENGYNVMDFTFDPLDPRRIAIGLDNSTINVWSIPEDISQPISPGVLTGHYDKITTLAFHPQAKDLLASSSYDQKIILWDLSNMSIKIELGPLNEAAHSLSWSCNGKYIAALSRDHTLSVFDPRASTSPVKEGKGPGDSRGGRIIWLTDEYILTTGFNKSHNRIVCLFSVTGDITCLNVLEFDNCPSVFVPYYDPDICVVFLTGKGDAAVLTLEFDATQDPFLFQTATFNCPSGHQGICLLPKTLCDVSAVQVDYGLRLCNTSIEQFTFSIPRVRKEYFQDDLYPPTLIWWVSAVTVSEWLDGRDKLQTTTNMCPSGMKPLSKAPQQVAAPKKYQSFNKAEKTDKEKKDELISAMVGKMGEHEDDRITGLEDVEGVDSDEWDDD